MKISDFLALHGKKFFVTGFLIFSPAILVYVLVNPTQLLWRQVSFYGCIAGLAIYLVGRIGVAIQSHRARKLRQEALKNGSKDIV